MSFTPPDPTQPADSDAIANGAGWIRQLKQYLVDFLSVSFDLTTGAIKPSAIPNGLPSPYGTAGNILQSTGPATAPAWTAVGTVVPAGAVIDFAGSAAPAGYLLCDGSVKNIADYPALATVLGTTFGGDGITTFGLPDCRGRTTVGLGTGDAPDATAWTLGLKKGEEGHTLITAELPTHNHSVPHGQNGMQADGNAANAGGILSGRTSDTSGDAGSDDPHNNIQPSLGLNKIIKT